MAKMFYSLEEVQDKLGKNAEELKQQVADGGLREFRDGAKLMFKVDEVDGLAGGLPDDAVSLPPDDSLAEGSSIGLMPLGDTADSLSLSPEESVAPLSPDASELSGSQFDMDPDASGTSELGISPMSKSSDQISLDDSDTVNKDDKDGTVITSHGVNVLDDSDAEFDDIEVDPMAQTQIAPDLADQVHLDSGSNGSGLLDLTREADDTSLGAELLEEIYPGDEDATLGPAVPDELDIPDEATASLAEQEIDEPQVQYKQVAEVMDPTSGVFGAMLVLPLLFLILMAFATAAGISGVRSNFLNTIGEKSLYVLIGGIVITLLIGGVGVVLTGQTSGPAKAKKPKAKSKPKKEKKSRKK
jgi:hypothetical protein